MIRLNSSMVSKIPIMRQKAITNCLSLHSSGISVESQIQAYKNHLMSHDLNPTIAMLLESKYLKFLKKQGKKTKKIIENNPEIKKIKKNIENNLKRIYPKTNQIRKYIANSGRVKLENTKESKTYNLFDKAIIYIQSLSAKMSSIGQP